MIDAAAVRALVEDVLATHHDFAHREGARLDDALPRGGADRPVMVQWRRLRQLLEHHLMKEEVSVFPGLLSLLDDVEPPLEGIERQMAELDVEHRHIDKIDEALRPLLPRAGVEAAALEAFLDDLRVHARREEEGLLPALRELIGSH